MDAKTYLILLCGVALCHPEGLAQRAQDIAYTPQMVLFADAGIRQLSFDNLASTLNKENFATPSFSYFIGASAYFLAKKMIFGLTFNNAFGNADNATSTVSHSGLSAGGEIGYKILQRKSFLLAPIIGMSTTGNMVSVTEKNTAQKNNSRIYKNGSLSLNGSFLFEYVTPINMSFGIKAGYDYSLNQDHEWEAIGSKDSITISDAKSGFFFALIIGGHINVKKAHKPVKNNDYE